MLTQRILCRNWQKQISLSTMFSLPKVTTNFLLHHSHPRLHILAIRSLRTSRSRLAPPRTPTTIQATPFENMAFGSGSVPPGNVVKALVFTGAFSAGCFLGATVMEYENTRNMMLEKARQHKFPWLKRKEKQNETSGYWKNLKHEVQQLWDQLTPGEKVFAPLCALNLLVFAMWRVPRLKNTMMTYFCSNPAGRAVCWPMFLSTFSHYSTFHIFANMYVLHSFSNAAVLSLGKEQFLAVYLSAGVIASLSSILYKAVSAQAGMSLGASGAIMAILAFVCAQYPDTQLSILFLPMVTFSAGSAIKVIMGIDLAGCLLGWKFFDHAAHLGGALFGIFWAFYGSDVWQRRIRFLSMYHDWRKTK